jgi:hypothetical protein
VTQDSVVGPLQQTTSSFLVPAGTSDPSQTGGGSAAGLSEVAKKLGEDITSLGKSGLLETGKDKAGGAVDPSGSNKPQVFGSAKPDVAQSENRDSWLPKHS